MDKNSADFWIAHLDLKKHPEGGYYRETYRSAREYEGRNLATSIYYLLPGTMHSHFHRLRYDEHWYFHVGASLKIYFLKDDGQLETRLLGGNPERGEALSQLIPAGTIFGGEVTDANSFILVSCNMSPGFHFEDFEMFSNKQLVEMFPQHRDVIDKLT